MANKSKNVGRLRKSKSVGRPRKQSKRSAHKRSKSKKQSKRYKFWSWFSRRPAKDPAELGFELGSELLRMDEHIKSHPPRPNDDFPYITAWRDFSDEKYPQYEKEIDNVESWPKYMFLIYNTYKLCYEKWYELRLDIQLGKYALDFDRQNDELISYIYKTYHHLDKSISLDKFIYYGY